MRKIVLGDRSADPAFFDLCGHRPYTPDLAGYFRIGDRAAAYIFCTFWRHSNPHRKLIVLDNPTPGNPAIMSGISSISAEWMFEHVADEVWLPDDVDELLPKPDAEPLYREPVWQWWHDFNLSDKPIRPSIVPKESSVKHARRVRREWGLGKYYATVQPFFDAAYATHRNIPVSFWKEFIWGLSVLTPVVVLGSKENSHAIPESENVYQFWKTGASVMDSLAMIYDAQLHVGGETGTTIWSPILGTDTLGVYPNVVYEGKWFSEPVEFVGRVSVCRGLNEWAAVKAAKKILAESQFGLDS